MQVDKSVSTPELPSRTVELTGIGTITRIDKIDDHKGKKFGVALKFSEKLKVDV